ncbi:hypothetical protein RclHR1_19880001 [Rhizophagus clarus]|uniref:Uncharacterized protein n=1 Tax=Rhizophagus clarus TaxID=94130 RepID=A0A2Z6R5I2_9GLOM|nr:hypothetical protein RclHR1_19880001 [Rhizophagus clarus]
MQVFLTTPKYNKIYIYKTPTSQYQKFYNAFEYYRMVNTGNPAYPKVSLCTKCTNTPSQHLKSTQTNQVPQRPIEEIIVAGSTLPSNASAQKKASEIINSTNMKLAKLQQIYNSTNNLKIWNNLSDCMETLKQTLHNENNKIKRLKRQAEYQQRSRAKKAKLLQEHQEIIKYDSPGHPPLLIQYSDLYEHIHECIEFGTTDKKRRKEVIKVRIIRYLQEELNSKYNEYFSRTTLNNYLLPSRSNTKAAKAHHHPAIIANASVSQTERNEHIDEHYCLASMKEAKQFAALFSTHSIIISQDDKAKVPLSIPAVGKTFQTLQNFQEPVTLLNHDFLVDMQQKLIPSVYLLINLSDTNDAFHNGQLLIFIRSQYQVGINSSTYMSDLNSLIQDNRFDGILKINSQIKPIWILLVDGGPDENLPYNPVEHSMSTLSQKLAGIILLIDKFGSHLNSQGQIIDSELAMKNFHHAGELLCTLWKCDPIFGKPVTVQYTDQKRSPFDDIIFPRSVKESDNESDVPWQ